MADIDLNDLTNATTVTDGTGVLDRLMNVINIHIEDQYDKGRITGPEYATVYVGSVQTAISESVKFLLGEQAAANQADLIAEQVITEQEKQELVQAQSNGFKHDAKQKLLKLMADMYSINLSIAGDANVPESGQDAAIDQMVQEIMKDLDSAVIVQSNPQVPDAGEAP
jgi:hypothetical protein